MGPRRALLAAAVAAAVLGGLPSAHAALAGKAVRLGVLIPTTGPFAGVGMFQKIALDIAREEINAAGGIGGLPLELVTYDIAADPAQSVTLTRKLIAEDKVLAILGPFTSDQCEVAFPVANRAGVPIITASAGKPGLGARNRPWAFVYSFSPPAVYGPLIARWVRDHNIKRVAIVYDAKLRLMTVDGRELFPAILKRVNVEVTDSLTLLTGDVDFSAQVTRLKALNPDGVVLSTAYSEAGNFLREMRKQGLPQPVVGGIAIAEPRVLEIAREAAEGLYMGTPFWVDYPDAATRAFVEKFRARFQGRVPSYVGAAMYDALYITKRIIERGGVTNRPEDLEGDRARIRDGWTALKDDTGLLGPATMTPEGEAAFARALILTVKGGKLVRLE